MWEQALSPTCILISITFKKFAFTETFSKFAIVFI